MKKLIALVILSSVAHAESDNLSWFSTPQMTFDGNSEQPKQETIIQPLPTPVSPLESKKSNKRVIRSLDRIDAIKVTALSPELKKCRNVFRATLNPSPEDAQSTGISMGLSPKNSQNFKPDSLSIIFSTDPSCSHENNRSPQFSSLLNELRQIARAKYFSGGMP